MRYFLLTAILLVTAACDTSQGVERSYIISHSDGMVVVDEEDEEN